MRFTAAAISLAAASDSGAQTAGTYHVYKDPTKSITERADDLISKMTLEEKIRQTYSPYGGSAASVISRFNSTSVGELSIKTAGGHNAGTPAEVVAGRNKIQEAMMQSRLQIPVSFSQEALHSGAMGGTVFPELVTQGSTWDPALIKEMYAAVAAECRMIGVDLAFGPVLNMWIDSRFGRLQEGFTENPTLTAAYAVAAAEGLQGTQPAGKWEYFNDTKVVSLAKHYAAYGAAAGGLNGAPAELSERTLREWYLRPWRAFAKAGGKGAMTAHNTVLNRPCHSHPYLVNKIFREEYQFGDGE